MKCDRPAADLWLLAAGELPEKDAERLTLHASACAYCAGRLANAGALFRSNAEFQSVRPVSPPANIKAQLMARIAAGRPRQGARWPTLVAASLVGAMLGGGLTGWVAKQSFAPREDLLQFELALVRESNEKQQQRVAALDARLEGLERQAVATTTSLIGFDDPQNRHGVDARSATQADLVIGPGPERAQAWRAFLQWAEEDRQTGSLETPHTTAQVFCLESEGLCVLRAAGLPAPQAGESYALWLTNVVGRYYLVGTFEADANGEASLLASAPVDVRDVARGVVTLEPGEAGWRPAGSVVLVEGSSFN